MKKSLTKVSLLLLALFALSACKVSTANVINVKTCLESEIVDELCSTDVPTFAKDAAEIFLTAELENAPTDTEITFLWKYLDEDLEIDTVSVIYEESGSATLYTSLPKPTFEDGWPAGNYEIVVSLDSDNFDPISKKFSVSE